MATAGLLSELMETLRPEARAEQGVTLPESPRASGTWGTDSVSVLRKEM